MIACPIIQIAVDVANADLVERKQRILLLRLVKAAIRGKSADKTNLEPCVIDAFERVYLEICGRPPGVTITPRSHP